MRCYKVMQVSAKPCEESDGVDALLQSHAGLSQAGKPSYAAALLVAETYMTASYNHIFPLAT